MYGLYLVVSLLHFVVDTGGASDLQDYGRIFALLVGPLVPAFILALAGIWLIAEVRERWR